MGVCKGVEVAKRPESEFIEELSDEIPERLLLKKAASLKVIYLPLLTSATKENLYKK